MNYHKTTYIAKLEKAIAERWGEIATENPSKFWNEEVAEEYKEEVEKLEQKILEKEHSDRQEEIGEDILISGNMLEREGRENCDTCGEYSFKSRDDIYLRKYGVCKECYFEYIHNREERWENGWRPDCYEA